MAVVSAWLLLSATPAWGGSSIGAFDDPAGGTVTATASQSPPTAEAMRPVSVASAVEPCQYLWVSGTDLAGPDGTSQGAWAVPYPSDPSYCVNGLQPGPFSGPEAYWVPTAQAGPGAPGPRALATQALSQAAIALPQVQTWPPSGRGEVNFSTWVHVSSWAPVSASATAAGLTVTVTATPTKTIVSSFDSDDGGATYQPVQVTCPGPGSAYDPDQPYADQHTDCSMTWSWPSAHYGSGSSAGSYPLTVTVVYAVTWAGPGGGGALPAITRSTTLDYPVGEIEALGS